MSRFLLTQQQTNIVYIDLGQSSWPFLSLFLDSGALQVCILLVCELIICLVLPQKKRVTAGGVDKLGKELGNCTRQWTMNDETNTQALSTLSLLQVKEERQTTTEGRKKQRRGQTRRRQPFLPCSSAFDCTYITVSHRSQNPGRFATPVCIYANYYAHQSKCGHR